MREQRELFLRIKYKYPNAKEFEMRDGTLQIIFGIYIVVYQKIRYKEFYSIIIRNESIQNERRPQNIWDIIKNNGLEKTRLKMMTKQCFKRQG